MAKTKPQTLVEKVIEGANNILHPSHDEASTAPHFSGGSEDPQLAQAAAETKARLEAEKASKASKPKSAHKSEMGKHKKFDKFN